MKKLRGFEVAKGWENKGINIPERQTKNSAGYDFESAVDVIVPGRISIIETMLDTINDEIDRIGNLSKDMDILDEIYKESVAITEELTNFEGLVAPTEFKHRIYKLMKSIDEDSKLLDIIDESIKAMKPVLVPTGIKAYMLDDEKLDLYNRSSNPGKHGLVLANGVGLVDSDYYENEDNDGHIMFSFINVGYYDHKISKGDRIGQGVFTKFLKIDNDDGVARERTGGYGSTK